MSEQKAEGIERKKRSKASYVEGNGNSLVEGWGMVHCAECELPIGFFPPDVEILDDGIEIYCQSCAIALNQDGQ